MPASRRAAKLKPQTAGRRSSPDAYKASIVIYDTEAANWEDALERGWGGEGQHPEIIQIAAVKVDDHYEAIARFDVLIKPTINPVVSDFFAKLTGIEQEEIVAIGMSFTDAYRRFLEFCNGSYVICNGWDREAILENLNLYRLNEVLPLVNSRNIRPWIIERGIPRDSRGQEGWPTTLVLP